MPKPTALTPASFLEFVSANKFALVHFWAAWNGHDTRMAEIIESQIPNDLSDKIGFATFDVDQAGNAEICLEHKIRNIPFLAFYRDGSLIRSNTGLLAPDSLIEYLKQLLNPQS